jgi:hypothetical protein
MHSLEISTIENEHQRRLAAIKNEYETEKALIALLGDTEEARQRKQQAEDKYNLSNKIEGEHRAIDIKELRLRGSTRNERVLAEGLLNLEKERALAAIADPKTGLTDPQALANLNEEFALKEKILHLQNGGQNTAAIGLFNPAAAGQALGGTATRTWEGILAESKLSRQALQTLIALSMRNGQLSFT